MLIIQWRWCILSGVGVNMGHTLPLTARMGKLHLFFERNTSKLSVMKLVRGIYPKNVFPPILRQKIGCALYIDARYTKQNR